VRRRQQCSSQDGHNKAVALLWTLLQLACCPYLLMAWPVLGREGGRKGRKENRDEYQRQQDSHNQGTKIGPLLAVGQRDVGFGVQASSAFGVQR